MINVGAQQSAKKAELDDRGVSVKDKRFGAKGDGFTDDTAAIQAAFDYVNSIGGGKVIFPKGIYIISSKLIFYSNMTIQGVDATVKLKAGSYSALVTMFVTVGYANGAYNPSTPIVENVVIDGLIIDGNKANITTTDSCTGINAYKVYNFKVTNCTIKDLPGIIGNGYGIITWYSNTVQIENVIIDKTDRQNICIWETLNAHIDRCTLNFSYFRDNILVSGNSPFSYQASYCTVENTQCSNDSTTGTHVIRFAGSASGVVQNCILSGNTSREGMYCVCDDDIFVKFVGNTISNCLYGFLAEHDAIGQTFIVENNKILNCVNGVRLNLVADTAIVNNNKIIGTTTDPLYFNSVKHVVAEGNEINGGTGYVSCFVVTSFHFINNKIRSLTSASYAVLFNTSSAGIPIIGNNTCESNTNNDIRVLMDAKAYGNRANINSTTTRFDLLNKYAMYYATVAPTTLPTGATIGDTIINSLPSRVKNITHWRLISLSGSGTWFAYGTGWGTTAERPTLAAQDAGYSFFDSTLAKMILWNGTAWLV